MSSSIKSEIVKFGKLLYERHLNAAYGGNLSIRDGDKVYITPSGLNKAFMEEVDIMVTDLDGNVIERPIKQLKPSSEAKMHYAIYKTRANIKAVIHSHPPYCISLAISHQPVKQLLPETTIMLGKVVSVPYITPGGFELGNAVAKALKNADACIMGNHGATAIGKDLFEAFNKIELLESTVKSFIFAKLMGKVNTLPEKDGEAFINMYRNLS